MAESLWNATHLKMKTNDLLAKTVILTALILSGRSALGLEIADAGRIAVSKAAFEDPMLRAMREFEGSMAEDSVRNHYDLHTQIHEWFAQDVPDVALVNRLNNRVYAELFLMPSWDPWLGLRPPNAYSALEADGATLASTTAAK